MSYILGQEKPQLDELVIHYGVKGMRWGVRKDRVNSTVDKAKNKAPRLSDRQKKVVKRASKTALAVGVVATTYILGKNSGMKTSDAKAAARIKEGTEFIHKSLWGDAAATPNNLYRLTPSEVSYVDFIIRDTFKNRV